MRVGASPAESLPDVTPDPTGLKQLQSAFPGNSGVAALAGFSPYGVKQGDPQPTSVSAGECAQIGRANANGTCSETVTGPGGKTAIVEVAGVQREIQSLTNDQEELGRLDWQPTSKDHLFVRYFYQPELSTGVGGTYAVGAIAAGDFVDVPSTTHSVGADWTRTFSAHFIDQLQQQFSRGKKLLRRWRLPQLHCHQFWRLPC